MEFEAVQPGLVGEAETTVTEGNTALHHGSGLVSVFATPAMIALMEQAAVSSVTPHLPSGWQTVGISLDVRHLAATPVGMTVTARAELIEVDGRRLRFQVTAHDDRELVGEGTHQRFIIDLERFEQRALAKHSTK